MVRSSVFLSKGLKEIIIMTIIIIIWLFDLEVDSDVFLSIFHARSVFFLFPHWWQSSSDKHSQFTQTS